MSQPDETTLQARVQELESDAVYQRNWTITVTTLQNQVRELEKEVAELHLHLRGKEALLGFAVAVTQRQNQMIKELGAELEKYKAARNAAATQEQTNGR